MFVSTVLSLLVASASASVILDKRTALSDCLTAAKVPTLTTGSSDYTLAIKPFNLRLPFTPAAVTQPTTLQQIQDAVACGVKNNVPISPKGGGHSYASHGLGGENGHLMIDMKFWTNITVESSTGIATIGTGSRLGNIATALSNQGGRAFSHGTCPGVGIAGHVLGGGYGYSSRTWGLALDAVVEAQVVLANSTVVTASNTTNSDLFWALRGGGSGSFGVVTQYKVQTHAAPTTNTVFSYNYYISSVTAAANMHKSLQNYAAGTSMPTELNLRMFITANSFNLEGVYYGSTSGLQTALAPLFSAMGNPSSSSVQTMSYMQALNNYAYGSLTTPLNYDTHETFFSKSLMTSNLTDAAFTAFWTYWNANARSNTRDWYLIIDLHGGPSSAISKVADNATSYAHRQATLKYEFYDRVDYGSYPSNGFDFLNGWVGSILTAMPTTDFGMYMNYADASLNATQARDHYWLGHYKQLTQIKAAYDPKVAFSNPQAVGLS